MKPKAKRTMYILLITASLSICFLSCKKNQEKPEEISKIGQYEQLSDSELNQTDSQGKTLLHHAVVEGDTE